MYLILSHLSFRNDLTEHRTIIPENLSNLSGIHTIDSGNLLLLHPCVETLHRVPVAILERILRNDKAAHPYFLRLEILGNSVLVDTLIRYSIVSDQRISYT